jgi:hypothetical protein
MTKSIPQATLMRAGNAAAARRLTPRQLKGSVRRRGCAASRVTRVGDALDLPELEAFDRRYHDSRSRPIGDTRLSRVVRRQLRQSCGVLGRRVARVAAICTSSSAAQARRDGNRRRTSIGMSSLSAGNRGSGDSAASSRLQLTASLAALYPQAR